MLEHKSTLKIILTRDSMTHTITETKDNIHTTGSALSQATMPEHCLKDRLKKLPSFGAYLKKSIEKIKKQNLAFFFIFFTFFTIFYQKNKKKCFFSQFFYFF